MWDDVGILRTATGLSRARHELNNLAAAISMMGVADTEKRYNLTWMDRLNLENLVLVSRAICAAAQARTDSRGAHYREDFPETAKLADSRYTVVRAEEDSFEVSTEPVVVHPRSPRPIAVAAGGGMNGYVPANGELKRRKGLCVPAMNPELSVHVPSHDSKRARRVTRPSSTARR